jgi:hypothetical protein
MYVLKGLAKQGENNFREVYKGVIFLCILLSVYISGEERNFCCRTV